MKILIAIILILIALSVIGYIASIIFYEKQRKQFEQDADEDYNVRHSAMCQQSIKSGVCPKCCEKCAWAQRKKDGKILTFREREK